MAYEWRLPSGAPGDGGPANVQPTAACQLEGGGQSIASFFRPLSLAFKLPELVLSMRSREFPATRRRADLGKNSPARGTDACRRVGGCVVGGVLFGALLCPRACRTLCRWQRARRPGNLPRPAGSAWGGVRLLRLGHGLQLVSAPASYFSHWRGGPAAYEPGGASHSLGLQSGVRLLLVRH